MNLPSEWSPSALLTHGRGPVARAAFDFLVSRGEPTTVVLARNPPSVSNLGKVRAYGIPYAIDKTIDRIYHRRSVVRPDSSSENAIEYLTWDGTEESVLMTAALVDRGIRTIVMAGFPFIVRASFLESFVAVLNVHPSPLPAYRGPEPVFWGILEGADSFGVTVHLVDEGVDTGPILAIRRFPRPTLALSARIRAEQARLVPQVLEEAFEILRNGQPTPQDEVGSYRPKPTLANRRMIRNRAE